jgi:hypothetical protein
VRAAGLAELRGLLEEKAREHPEVPPIAPEAITGGIMALARRRFLRKGAEGLPSLAPIATYLALAPYVGAEEACAVANGDGRARPDDGSPAMKSPTPGRNKWVVQSMLGARWIGAAGLAEELGAPVEEIAGYLVELEADGLVESMVLPGGEETEWTAAKRFRVIDGEDWAALTDEERRDIASTVVRFISSDLDEGLQAGSFGLRLDEHHTRLMVELDQAGWTEMAEAHRAAYEASQAIRVGSERRLRKSGEKGIVGRSVQVLFELPEEE